MSPQGPPGDRAADEGSRAAGGRFPAQPYPTDQSVLWRPAVQELARPDSDATLIFVAQRALAAVEDHLLSAPQQALLGYLIGRLFESPGSGLPYLVVHGAVRVPQMIVADASERVVAQSLGAVQRMLPPEDGVVVGWYRSDPTGALKVSASDHAAHTHHFPRPWQIALLVTSDPAAPRGGFFRPAGAARGLWGWWIVACGAIVGAVALGVRLGLRPVTPAGPAVEVAAPPAPPTPAPEIVAATAARRAVDAYRLRSTLFANHQMT